MSETLHILVALAGTDDPKLPEQLARVIGVAGGRDVELLLLHVVDDGPVGLLAHGYEAHRAPWPASPRRAVDDQLAAADAAGASALLAAWTERFAAALPGYEISGQVRTGRPEQELVLAARELAVDLVVLSPRPRPGPTEPGPRALGHVARFVVDHSPAPVLLVRHD